jgi:hypothetical protein
MHSLLAVALLFVGQVFAQCPGTAGPSVCGIDSISEPGWMAEYPDDRSISELSIPGTHESLAIEGGSLFECQENHGESADTLTTQLIAGIRAFDIRLRITDGGKFTIHHASHYMNANFDDVLNKIGSFLNTHSSETVLFRLKQECTGEFASCTDATGDFQEIFKSYVSSHSDLFWAPSVNGGDAAVPKLGDVRGKAVLAVMNGANGGRFPAFGLAQFSDWDDGSSTYVQDEYNVPNSGAIATKRDQVRRFLDKVSAGDRSKLFFNFSSGASILASPWNVAAGAGGTTGVNPFLLGYLREGEDVHPKVVRTGVIMMDYPGPELITQIINTNKEI